MYGKAYVDGRVSRSYKGPGHGVAEPGNSRGRAGSRRTTNDVHAEIRVIAGSGVTDGQPGTESASGAVNQSLRNGAGNCGVAGTSGVHRQEMGGRRPKEKKTERIMKTLVTAIQKGGQGKTFATCHLAFDFAERGLRVAVIDLDTQGNASFTLSDHQSGFVSSQLFAGNVDELRGWFDNRDNNGIALIAADADLANLDKMDLSHAAGALRNSVAALGDYFDVCLIDTAPSLGVGMTAAVLSADYMLSPVEMEAYSLHGMRKMVAVVSNLRKMNPKLRFLGMVPNKVDARKPRHIANLAAVQEAYPQLVLPISIGMRDSIAEALGEQMPVWMIKKTAARLATKEVRALANYVFEKMEIK